MANEYMCNYGNCTETAVVVTVTDKVGGERSRFCCQEHAGLYMLRRAWMYEGQRKRSYADEIAGRVASELQN